jgi:hypothetical protein
MYPLYLGQEVPGNMLSYVFSCYNAIATLAVPKFILLPVFLSFQSVHVPDLPAVMQSSQLWTPTTFFWLNSFQPYFGESLRYM